MSNSVFYFFIGLFWGGVNCPIYNIDSVKILQAIILLSFLLVFFLINPNSLWCWTKNTCGLLIAAHALGALLSWSFASNKQLDLIRYIALIPSFSIAIFMQSRQIKTQFSFLSGLVLSGALYLTYLFTLISPQDFSDPKYRLSVLFDHPNRIAFIADVSIVALYWVIRNNYFLSKVRFFLVSLTIIDFVVLLATKSRTGFVAMIGGILFFEINARLINKKVKLKYIFIYLMAGLIVSLFTSEYLLVVAGKFSDFFSLFDPYRSIATGTGRFQSWRFTINYLLKNNIFLGLGPGNNISQISKGMETDSIDNAFINNISEVGLIGTIPLVLITFWCFRVLWRNLDLRKNWAGAIFITCFLTSLASNYLFSMGSPASLVFLLAVAHLTAANQYKND